MDVTLILIIVNLPGLFEQFLVCQTSCNEAWEHKGTEDLEDLD